MYEDYMQSFFNYPINGYQNTYDQKVERFPYEGYYNRNMSENNCNLYYPFQTQTQFTNSREMSNNEIEGMYPEIYKIIYPMVKRVCSQNNKTITPELIENMVDIIYTNIETNNEIDLNITINNDLRGEKKIDNSSSEKENRALRRNNNIADLIKILILRELIGRPRCPGNNCRPGMYPPPRPPYMDRPPFPRYEF